MLKIATDVTSLAIILRRGVLRFAFFSACLLPLRLFSAQQAAPSHNHVRQLSADEISAIHVYLKPTLIPRLADDLQIDTKQAFVVESKGIPSLYINPARYDSYDTEVPQHTSYRCGIFLRSANSQAQFVTTIGYNWTEAVQCTALKAIGFLDGPDRSRPRILLLYDVQSPNAASTEPVILDWNPTTHSYAANENLSRSLEDDPHATTIPSMKRRILSGH